MSGIDKLPVFASEVQVFMVLPYPMYFGPCSVHRIYSPRFPVVVNGVIIGYPCGNCITDSIEELNVKNPSAIVSDSRKYLYN